MKNGETRKKPEAKKIPRKKRFYRALAQIPLMAALFNASPAHGGMLCNNEHFAAVAPSIDTSSNGDLQIGSFNIAKGRFGIKGVEAVLEKHRTIDVANFQEASMRDVKRLEKATGLRHAATSWNTTDFIGTYGNLTLTNLSIVSIEEYMLSPSHDQVQRTMLVTVLRDKTGRLVVNANAQLTARNRPLHAGEKLTVRETETQRVLKILGSPQYADLPTSLSIDLNAGPGRSEYQSLKPQFHDTADDINKPSGGLVTVAHPPTQSDYIFISGDLALSDLETFGEFSDHCEVVGDFWPKYVPSPIQPLALDQGPK